MISENPELTIHVQYYWKENGWHWYGQLTPEGYRRLKEQKIILGEKNEVKRN